MDERLRELRQEIFRLLIQTTFLEKMEICAGKQIIDFVLLQSWSLYFWCYE